MVIRGSWLSTAAAACCDNTWAEAADATPGTVLLLLSSSAAAAAGSEASVGSTMPAAAARGDELLVLSLTVTSHTGSIGRDIASQAADVNNAVLLLMPVLSLLIPP
jgi:hypothetical protein